MPRLAVPIHGYTGQLEGPDKPYPRDPKTATGAQNVGIRSGPVFESGTKLIKVGPGFCWVPLTRERYKHAP